MPSRPEHLAPPEIFYNEDEAKKYTTKYANKGKCWVDRVFRLMEGHLHASVALSCSHIAEVQRKVSERAMELLNLEGESRMLLDIGCGSGLSGDVITESGHFWVGVDISESMLSVALERGVEGDLFLWDVGHGLTFRPGVFDGAISVSAIQWLCNADKSSDNSFLRIKRFFSTLYVSLARGARAVLQAYPENSYQMDILATAAAKAGFGGGWLVDYPNSTRARKYYLVLFAGTQNQKMPAALEGGAEGFRCESDRSTRKKKDRRCIKKSKEWILLKKERRRRQGLEVRPNSKYTGRKRRSKAV